MRILGLDGGIASIGWALIDIEDGAGQIVAMGTRMFDAPETDKERAPTNAVRRGHRGQRRVIRRRRQRMNQVRHLFAQHGLLPDSKSDSLRRPGLNPWEQRVRGLDHHLAGEELAVALGHIARHRAFRSNSKADRQNAASDSSKMLKAIATTQERIAGYRTIGEFIAKDAEFQARKRNRGGDFSRSLLRADLESEVRTLFAAQRWLGNQLATEELQESFATIAFTQRLLQAADHLVGDCPFEAGEKRAARRAYSFERFRLLSRLAHMAIASGRSERRLTPDEIRAIADDFGDRKKITYRSVRKLLGLTDTDRFTDANPEEETRDIVARSGNAAEGTATLRAALPEASWHALLATPEKLDAIAAVLSFRDDLAQIRQGLDGIGLDPLLTETLERAAAEGAFAAFKGAGHISAKAARALIPYLAQGNVYSEACTAAGYDHAARPATNLDDIRNPVARKALGEMLKQVRVIVHEFGLPDRIHVELGRDVGKSAEERDEITRGIEKRNKERDRHRADFAELLGREPLTVEEMIRYELWKEQGGRCLYSDAAISPAALAATDNTVQVDHILPWSRFGDDSFVNKTLCTARANQQKRGRTPFEWLGDDEQSWQAFTARVEGCKSMKGRKKKGFYLRRNAAEVEEKFRNRNLGDTRYATRLLREFLARLYPEDLRQVLARPGALTAKLRRAWGVDDLKKDSSGKRLPDDRHHALDALVLAATSESMLQNLTRAAQAAERSGAPRGFDFNHVQEPWPGFREDARTSVAAVFVSRSERRRARGEAHAATIRQVRERDGKTIVYERKAVESLKRSDLDRVKDADRNAALIGSLRAWLEAGSPKDAPPLSPKGDPIRKVRLATDGKPAVVMRRGAADAGRESTADRGEMARVDMFAKADKRGRVQFYAVPIYPHQIASKEDWPQPPDRAVVAFKSEDQWTIIDKGFSFRFSLYQNSLIEMIKPDGEVLRGYFKGMDRSTAGIAIGSPENPRKMSRGVGSKTLVSFRKFAIDRLGRISEIPRETRTWHGVVCT